MPCGNRIRPARGEASAPRIEIRDRDAEQRQLGRTGLVSRAPAGRDRFGRPAFGPGQRPGAFPKKKVAAAGKKLKQTQITTPAEHKRVIRMGDTIAVADLAKEMAVKAHQIINSSEGELRYIAVGNRTRADVIEYPDSGRLAVNIAHGNDRDPPSVFSLGGRFSALGYWDGEDVGGDK